MSFYTKQCIKISAILTGLCLPLSAAANPNNPTNQAVAWAMATCGSTNPADCQSLPTYKHWYWGFAWIKGSNYPFVIGFGNTTVHQKYNEETRRQVAQNALSRCMQTHGRDKCSFGGAFANTRIDFASPAPQGSDAPVYVAARGLWRASNAVKTCKQDIGKLNSNGDMRYRPEQCKVIYDPGKDKNMRSTD